MRRSVSRTPPQGERKFEPLRRASSLNEAATPQHYSPFSSLLLSPALKNPPHPSVVRTPLKQTSTCRTYNTKERSCCAFVLLANRSRDRRVPSKQFMLLGARRVRRALSVRYLRADNSPSGLAPNARWTKEGRGQGIEGRDVSACKNGSLSCRGQTRRL